MKTKKHLVQLCLGAALLLTLFFAARAQEFNYTSDGSQITTTGYNREIPN
jgi:hypothetical protein